MKTGSVFCQQHILNWVVELGCLWNPGVFLRLKFGKRFNQTSCVWFPEDIRIHQLLGFFQSVGLNRFMWIILLDWFPGPRWRLITIRWRVDRLISWLVLGVCQRIGLRNDNRYCLCGGFDYFLFFTPTRGDDPIWRTYLFIKMGWSNHQLENENRYCTLQGTVRPYCYLSWGSGGFFHRLKSGAWEGTPQEV